MRFHFLPYELLVFEFGEETGQRAILTSALERGAVVIVHRARGGTSARASAPRARARTAGTDRPHARSARVPETRPGAPEEAPRWKPRRKGGFFNDPRNDGPAGPALGAGVSRPRDVREGVVQGRGVPRRAVAPPRAAVPVHPPAARRRAAHRQRGSVRGASRANTRHFCEANGMKSTHPPARMTFSATSDATTNERRLTPRLTHDPSARALLTNARSTFRARVVHDRHAMRLSC